MKLPVKIPVKSLIPAPLPDPPALPLPLGMSPPPPSTTRGTSPPRLSSAALSSNHHVQRITPRISVNQNQNQNHRQFQAQTQLQAQAVAQAHQQQQQQYLAQTGGLNDSGNGHVNDTSLASFDQTATAAAHHVQHSTNPFPQLPPHHHHHPSQHLSNNQAQAQVLAAQLQQQQQHINALGLQHQQQQQQMTMNLNAQQRHLAAAQAAALAYQAHSQAQAQAQAQAQQARLQAQAQAQAYPPLYQPTSSSPSITPSGANGLSSSFKGSDTTQQTQSADEWHIPTVSSISGMAAPHVNKLLPSAVKTTKSLNGSSTKTKGKGSGSEVATKTITTTIRVQTFSTYKVVNGTKTLYSQRVVKKRPDGSQEVSLLDAHGNLLGKPVVTYANKPTGDNAAKATANQKSLKRKLPNPNNNYQHTKKNDTSSLSSSSASSSFTSNPLYFDPFSSLSPYTSSSGLVPLPLTSVQSNGLPLDPSANTLSSLLSRSGAFSSRTDANSNKSNPDNPNNLSSTCSRTGRSSTGVAGAHGHDHGHVSHPMSQLPVDTKHLLQLRNQLVTPKLI